MQGFCYSGVFLKVTPEIEELLIANYDNLFELDEDEIISEQISNVGGFKFCPNCDAAKVTPISNEGIINWDKSKMIYNYENFLYIAFPNAETDLRKPWLKENETLTDKIANDEAYDFIPKEKLKELNLEFYWLDIFTFDD